ncbi:hypothetical protein BDL97_09G055900 [Sphagnum fallax]|nr:hypothetical protein BDL97_09G055900 [Sphagnum fallax]
MCVCVCVCVSLSLSLSLSCSLIHRLLSRSPTHPHTHPPIPPTDFRTPPMSVCVMLPTSESDFGRDLSSGFLFLSGYDDGNNAVAAGAGAFCFSRFNVLA